MFDNYCFPKQVRLLSNLQFQETLAEKNSLLEKHYVLYYRPNRLNYPRLGIIVAKKKCPLAILRNKIKRHVRESFRVYQSKLPCYDIVIMTRQSAKEASPCELRQCLNELFLTVINRSVA